MTTHAIKNADDIKRLGTILSVWAHPDDETFTCGGIIATAVANGQKVACLTFTKGEAGVQDPARWPADKLAEIRTDELHKALHILGCGQQHLLDYPDGGLNRSDATLAVKTIQDLIKRYEPDTILTFGPDGMTGHEDHQTVSKWVSRATRQLSPKPTVYHAVELITTYNDHMKQLDEQFDIYFNIDKPPLKNEDACDICYCLPDDIADKKYQALRAMPSQTEAMLKQLDSRAKQVFARESFVRLG